MTDQPFLPDWTIPPAETLTAVFEERGVTLEQVATQAGVPPADLRKILDDHAPISPDLADRLGAALGASPRFWLNLDRGYRDDLVRLGRAVRVCGRCEHVLVGEDDVGWYYQVPVSAPETPGLTFVGRVHECDGQVHEVVVYDVSDWPPKRGAAHDVQ